MARTLYQLAGQVDRLAATDHLGEAPFVDPDQAARSALAACHNLEQARGHASPEHDQPPTAAETIRTALIDPEYASAIIERIFTAGLHLAAMHSLVQSHDPARIKLAAAIDELDAVIRSLRAGVFAGSLDQASSLTDGTRATQPPSHAQPPRSQRGLLRAGDQ